MAMRAFAILEPQKTPFVAISVLRGMFNLTLQVQHVAINGCDRKRLQVAGLLSHSATPGAKGDTRNITCQQTSVEDRKFPLHHMDNSHTEKSSRSRLSIPELLLAGWVRAAFMIQPTSADL